MDQARKCTICRRFALLEIGRLTALHSQASEGIPYAGSGAHRSLQVHITPGQRDGSFPFVARTVIPTDHDILDVFGVATLCGMRRDEAYKMRHPKTIQVRAASAPNLAKNGHREPADAVCWFTVAPHG
jgi:hypothetical protein